MCFLNGLFQIFDGRRERDIMNRKKDSNEDDRQFTVCLWYSQSLCIIMPPSDFDFTFLDWLVSALLWLRSLSNVHIDEHNLLFSLALIKQP